MIASPSVLISKIGARILLRFLAPAGAAFLFATSVSATTVPPARSQIGQAGENTAIYAPIALGATYRWQFNGVDIPNSEGVALPINRVQPGYAGLYTAVVTNAVVPTSDPIIFGIASSAKVLGFGDEVASNAVHPNGRIYDQILLAGAAVTVTAEPGKVTRVSFLDLNDDILQVEFSGAGTLSIVLAAATSEARPAKYNQAVTYIKGHAGIVVAGADETTNVSVFSVGRITAINQGLFKPDTVYDGVADLAFIAIHSRNGSFGGVRAGNARFFASQGLTGIYAPEVMFVGPVFVGDVRAYDAATGVLMFGSSLAPQVNGGSLAQANGQPVRVSGLSRLRYVDGTDSHGNLIPAHANQAKFERDGRDVTAEIVDDLVSRFAIGAGT